MKKFFGMMVMTLATAMLMTAPAAADSWNVGDTITYNLSDAVATPFGSGGLFTITSSQGAMTESFCIELNEHIYNGDRVAGVSDSAYAGGRNITGDPKLDPISAATDWLYTQFVADKTSYQDHRALQLAFWILEDETSETEAGEWVTSGYFNVSYLDTAKKYVADAKLYGTGYYGTRVLNLADAAGNPHQSQLVHNPVPVPPAILLLGSGLIGLLTVRRRKIRP